MPIHLSFKDYLRISKERIKGGLNMGATNMRNTTTVKTMADSVKMKAEQYRVRSHSGNVANLRRDIATLIGTGQIGQDDARWFAPGTDLTQLMEYVCGQNSTVSLIFKRGMTEQKVFVAGSPNASLPTTALKRIEIADRQGSHHVVWERWTFT